MKRLTIEDQTTGYAFTFYDNYLDTILRKFEGFEYASVRPSIDDTAGAQGSVYVTSKFGQRRLSIEGDLVALDPFAQRRDLVKVLRQTGVMKLIKFTTYDDLDLQCEAEVVKLTEPYNHSVHTYLIELIAPDWRFYAQTENINDIGRTILVGGTSITMSIPFGLPLTTNPETDITNIIINNGNDDSDPIFTISGPGNGFIVTNITTGKTFTLDYELIEGDSVIIDVRARTVVLNGVTNIYSAFDGDFWSVVPGENELNFLVQADFADASNLNVAFRDAYIGI